MARPLPKQAGRPPRNKLKPRRGTAPGIQKPVRSPGAGQIGPIVGGAVGPVNALPVDPIYTGAIGAIDLNYGNTLAGTTFDRTQIGQSYGFDQAGNLDPSNPYSVAANLQRRYQQGQQGTTNSMASGGQLYSGALQRNLDEGTFQYKRAEDSAKREAAGAYQDVTEREGRAEFDRSIGYGQAASDRLGRLDPQDVVPPTSAAAPGRVNPTQTKDHVAAGLKRTGPNTYIGPNGTYWHRTSNGTFARGKG